MSVSHCDVHLLMQLNISCRVDGDSSDVAAGDASSELLEEDKKALKKFLYNLAGHQNFIWFTAMNLVQVYNQHIIYDV